MLALVVCAALACSSNRASAPVAPSTVHAQRSPAPAPPPVGAPEVEPNATPTRGSVAEGTPCGELECRRFPSARQALAYVLDTRPLALGLGEAHALRGLEGVPSTVKRFTEELLPELSSQSSHLIVELLRPNPSCVETTQEVRRAQRPVTEPQAESNQNEYLVLGQRAKELGVEPFLLTPNCDELRAVSAAGADAIVASLRLIATITERMARGALHKNHQSAREAIVLAYGGAMHNDATPRPERADFSYGPGLSRFTAGRYVELDLIVREFIKDNDVWRALSWYERFDPSAHPDEAVLLRTAPASYVLFFPRAASPASGAASPGPP